MQEICIIIPCYNEAKRLPVNNFLEFYKQVRYHFCFVNDGSNDNTLEILNKIRHGREDRILVVDQKYNKGKAEAVRNGIIKSIAWKPFDITGYFDADLSTPLEEIHLLLENLNKNPDYLIAFGSRVKKMGSIIKRSHTRHYFGRIFSTFASLILHLPIYDTQCGAKIFKTELASEVFKEPFISKWLFDIEIFARIKKKFGLEKAKNVMIEVPLQQWIEKGSSRISVFYIFKIPFEILKIYIHY